MIEFTTSAAAKIRTTKSAFYVHLRAEYRQVTDRGEPDEVDEVIDGLVRQANEHRGTFTGYNAYLDCEFIVTPDEAPAVAAHKVGDRLHFRPTPERAPFGTIIDEGDVTVTEVIDHGTADRFTAAPRFSYVVQAADGQTQGTDDRELTEIEPLTIPAVTDAQRNHALHAAEATCVQVAHDLRHKLQDFSAARANELDVLAARLWAAAGHLRIADGENPPS